MNVCTTVTKQDDVIEFVLYLATEKCLRVHSWFSRNRWRSLIGSDRGHRNCLIRDDAVCTTIFSGSPHSNGLGVTQETTGEPKQSRHINEACATSFAHCDDAVIVSEMSPLIQSVTCTLQVVVELYCWKAHGGYIGLLFSRWGWRITEGLSDDWFLWHYQAAKS